MGHLARKQTLGELLWDDPDQDQWSKITRIMAQQRNRWILVQSGFSGSFDVTWSEWSWITDLDLDHPKGIHLLLLPLHFQSVGNESIVDIVLFM